MSNAINTDFLHIFKNTDASWNLATTELRNLTERVKTFTNVILGVNENSFIVKYSDEQFTLMLKPSMVYYQEDGGRKNIRVPELSDVANLEKIFYPICAKFLEGIRTLNPNQDLSDKAIYFLVRIAGGEIKKGVAEGWHHDYMWAPASYSSIIYLTAGGEKLTTANFCKWEFNKSNTRKFGTDTFGPGIGSIFSREQIYSQYEIFLNEYKKNNFEDNNIYNQTEKYVHKIAIKLSKNRIINARIVGFDTYKETKYIYFTLEPFVDNYYSIKNILKTEHRETHNFLYKKFIGTEKDGIITVNDYISLNAYNLSKDETQIFEHIKATTEKKVYKVKFDDWDINWKLKVSNLNPGSIGYNLLVGPDIYSKLFDNATDEEKNSLIHLHFGKPLYDQYMIQKSSELSGCPNDLYVEKINDLELLEGVIWDNKNTWHRSPFIPKEKIETSSGIRHFLNIRIAVVDKNIKVPFDIKDRDLSQLNGGFYQKYLKYKTKYLNLKKTLNKLDV